MKQVLIHIGYHKTASSWLQEEVFCSGNPVFEPLSRQDFGQSTLANDFFLGRDGYLLSPFESNEQIIREELDALKRCRPELEPKVRVLSHERLSGNPHSSGFDAQVIARRLFEIFPGGKVLVMLREQESFLLSCYFQYLSAGGTHSLEDYLNTGFDGKRPGFSPHHINYLPLLEHYLELFGEQNVLALPYEFLDREPASFFARLAEFLECSIDASSLDVHRRLNSRKNAWASYHLRGLNRFLVRSSLNDYSHLCNPGTVFLSQALVQFVTAITPEIWGERTVSGHKATIRQWTGGRYVQSNSRLQERLDIDLAKFSYKMSL